LFWGRPDLPTTKHQQRRKICRLAPSAIINASGFTNLRQAEASPHFAQELHVETPAFLASVSRDQGIPFVSMSSDYVFSGHGRSAWGEMDSPEPINAYGRSKLEGELAVMAANPNAKIIRTAGLFGPAPAGSKVSFPERVLRQVRAGHVPEVRSDLITSICYVDDLALDLRRILKSSSSGIFHVAHSGGATWLQIAESALESAGVSSRIKPIQTPDFPRPRCSVLTTCRLQGIHGRAARRSWQEALGAFMRGFRDV
jgi:dTDP-4-dehydrorhamnose reductase